MDTLSPTERSERMSRVRSRNTKPEMAVRRLVHGMGFRYRLHSRELPGIPDMIFQSKGKVVFIHGCFWHLHKNCGRYRLPKTNKNFWTPKLNENKKRDVRNQRKLRKSGWDYFIVWECELKDEKKLSNRLKNYLET